jgi:putative Holliday junction resolvase
MRVLGIDFGRRRIGLAVGETEFKIANPRNPLAAAGKLSTDARAIGEFAKKEEVELLVLGVPFHEGDDRMAKVCLRLAEELKQLGWEVRTVNEAGTSKVAAAELSAMGVKSSEQLGKLDGAAACAILEKYFFEEE